DSDIAHHQHLGVAKFEIAMKVVGSAMVTSANKANRNFFAGSISAEHRCRNETGHGQASHPCSDKLASGDSLHPRNERLPQFGHSTACGTAGSGGGGDGTVVGMLVSIFALGQFLQIGRGFAC